MEASKQFTHQRRWLVNRPLQLRFLAVILVTLGGFAIAMLGAVYFALWLTLSMFQMHRDPVTVQLFHMVGLFISAELLLCAPLFVWMVIWLVILWTHRVAGPLVRIQAALEQMVRGDLGVNLKLRRGDLLVELANTVNRLAESLRRR